MFGGDVANCDIPAIVVRFAGFADGVEVFAADTAASTVKPIRHENSGCW